MAANPHQASNSSESTSMFASATGAAACGGGSAPSLSDGISEGTTTGVITLAGFAAGGASRVRDSTPATSELGASPLVPPGTAAFRASIAASALATAGAFSTAAAACVPAAGVAVAGAAGAGTSAAICAAATGVDAGAAAVGCLAGRLTGGRVVEPRPGRDAAVLSAQPPPSAAAFTTNSVAAADGGLGERTRGGDGERDGERGGGRGGRCPAGDGGGSGLGYGSRKPLRGEIGCGRHSRFE